MRQNFYSLVNLSSEIWMRCPTFLHARSEAFWGLKPFSIKLMHWKEQDCKEMYGSCHKFYRQCIETDCQSTVTCGTYKRFSQVGLKYDVSFPVRPVVLMRCAIFVTRYSVPGPPRHSAWSYCEAAGLRCKLVPKDQQQSNWYLRVVYQNVYQLNPIAVSIYRKLHSLSWDRSTMYHTVLFSKLNRTVGVLKVVA